MPSTLACLRIFGYTASIVLHWGNVLSLIGIDYGPFGEDVKRFGSMQFRYMTCWNFFMQSTHASLGLLCEYLLYKNSKKKDYRLPKHLRGARDTLFAAIVVPGTFLVATVFWSLFLYDRNLILPAFVDQVLSPTSNHIMHTLIVPLALWELAFQPRNVPKSHTKNIMHILMLMVAYMAVLIYTYYERGFWIYPIFGHIYGTIYFYMLVLFIAFIAFFYYFVQWELVKLIWGGQRVGINKKIH